MSEKIMQGPKRISKQTLVSVLSELEQMLSSVRHVTGTFSPDEPFIGIKLFIEPTLSSDSIEELLQSSEKVLTARVPNEIPIRARSFSWGVAICRVDTSEVLERTFGGERNPGPDPRARYGSEDQRAIHDLVRASKTKTAEQKIELAKTLGLMK